MFFCSRNSPAPSALRRCTPYVDFIHLLECFPPLAVKCKDRIQIPGAGLLKDIACFMVYPDLLYLPLLRRNVEVLEKPAEPDHMNQFVADDIEHKRVKAKCREPIDGIEYGMVLDAYEVKIFRLRFQHGLFFPGPITDDLCEMVIHDFVGGQPG